MKKIMSLILSVVMLMSMLAGLALSAGAEGTYTYISDVYYSLGGKPKTLVAGKPLPELSPDTWGSDKYYLECFWLDEQEQELPAGTAAEFGKTYCLRIKVFPQEGYAFTKDCWIGGVEEYYTVGTLGDGAAELWGDNYYTAWNAIEKAEVTLAEPEVGQPLQMPVAIGENFEINETYTYWYDNTIRENVEVGTVAEAGHRYNAYIKLAPAEGYTFTSDTQLIFNGESRSISFDGVLNIDIYGFYDLRIMLDSFDFDLADPVVGQPFPQAVVAEDAGYTATTTWRDMHANAAVAEDALVAENGIYRVSVTLEMDQQHIMAEEVTLTVNGEEPVGYYYGNTYTQEMYYNEVVCFAQPLEKVEVTYAEPKVGQTPGEITVPEGANYYLGDKTRWECWDDDTDSFEAFENGKEYELNLYINAKTGYAVTEDTEFYVNGEKISQNDVDCYWTYLYYSQNYSFQTALEKVELPAWPELKVGDPIPEISGSGEGFSYSAYGYGYDSNGENIPMDVVQEGAAYWMRLSVEAEAGFVFDENTQITIGGKPAPMALYGQTESFELEKIYNFGAVSVVEQIDLKVHIPHVGQEGGVVSAPADAGYTAEEAYWAISLDGTMESAQEKEGPYQAGEHILLVVGVSAKPGWWIDSEATITLNGQEGLVVYGAAQKEGAELFFDLGVVSEETVSVTDGLNLVDGVWGYYLDGVLQVAYTGLVEFNGVWFYVENGLVDWEHVGLVEFNGQWLYVAGGAVEWDYTGLVEFGNVVFYVANGAVDWNYSGLLLFRDVWYYVEGGMVKADYTGLTQFGGYWFYVDGGTVDWDYVGLTQYNGWWFYVEGGMVNWEYNSLTQYNGYWFYINGGMVDWAYVGLVPFNGELFYISGGMVDWTYSGTVSYNGVDYNVENGMVVW